MEGFQGGGVDGLRLAGTVQFAGQFIGPDPVHTFGAEQRGHLLLLAQEGGKGGANGIGRNVRKREPAVHLLLQVVRRGGGAKADARNVLFVVVLQLLRPFAGIADANQQHPRCQRIQRTRMSHLQVLLPEVLDGGILELADDVGRGPAVGLVYRQHNAFRIVGNVTGETHLTGILSMRFWCRPPSNGVSSHSRTMADARR